MAKKESTKKTETKAKATKTAAKPTSAKKTAKATPTAKAQLKKSEARRADNSFTRTRLATARNTVVNTIGYLEDVRDLIDDALDDIA